MKIQQPEPPETKITTSTATQTEVSSLNKKNKKIEHSQKRKRSPSKEIHNKRPKLTVTTLVGPTLVKQQNNVTTSDVKIAVVSTTRKNKNYNSSEYCWSFKPLFDIYDKTKNLNSEKILKCRKRVSDHIDKIPKTIYDAESKQDISLEITLSNDEIALFFIILDKHYKAKDFKNKKFSSFLFKCFSKLATLTKDFCERAEKFEGWHILDFIQQVPDEYLTDRVKNISLDYDDVISRIETSNSVCSDKILAILKNVHPHYLICKGWDILLYHWYLGKLNNDCVYRFDEMNHFIAKLSVHTLAFGHPHLNDSILHQYAIPVFQTNPPNCCEKRAFYITEGQFLHYGPIEQDLPKEFQNNKVSLSDLCQAYTNLYLKHYELLRECFDQEDLEKEDLEDVVQMTLDMLFGNSRDRIKLETCVYGDSGICLVTLIKRPTRRLVKMKA